MKRSFSLGVKSLIAAAALTITGGAIAAAVVLPSQANSHAKAAVAAKGTPNAHAAFGQCVAAHAKTAGARHRAAKGKLDWKPTDGCNKPTPAASPQAKKTPPGRTP
jgi:hypothetical protein